MGLRRTLGVLGPDECTCRFTLNNFFKPNCAAWSLNYIFTRTNKRALELANPLHGRDTEQSLCQCFGNCCRVMQSERLGTVIKWYFSYDCKLLGQSAPLLLLLVSLLLGQFICLSWFI